MRRSLMRWLSPGTAALVFWLATAGGASAACTGATVLFQDNFDQLQPTWGEPNEALKLDNGQLVVMPAADQYLWQPNTANLYDDIDLFGDVKTVTDRPRQPYKGIALFHRGHYWYFP